MGGGSLYDRIGTNYTATRAEDPRIARSIVAALGDARTVLNVGAGTGSYEPCDRQVTAVEPSPVMIAHRAPGAAPAVRAAAEALPFEDAAFDAAMVVFSDHHWNDRERALGELARVTRDRVVLVNADPARAEKFWMTREYLPGFVRLIPERYRAPGAWTAEVEDLLGRVRLQPCRSHTIAGMGSTAPTGGAPRPTSTRAFAQGRRSSPCCPSPRPTMPYGSCATISTAAPGTPGMPDCSSWTNSIWATSS